MADTPQPVVLIVRDGWGENPNPDHDAFNAVKLAHTPCCDKLVEQYPCTLIATSGEDVGLNVGTMGNSEVGHQNLGAGRIVDQESVRITRAIRDGSFFANRVLVDAVAAAKDNGKTVHMLGIASDAGVHGLLTHLYACLQLCAQLGQLKVALHLFTDGRDTGPFTGREYVQQIQSQCRRIGVGRVVSVCGRYYAMDRDKRWQRVKWAYELLTRGRDADHFDSADQALEAYYASPTNDSQQGDEFITPRTVGADWQATRIGDGDSVIFYNYRGDRPRELTRAFVMDSFYGQVDPSPDDGEKGFARAAKLKITYVTMTAYQEQLNELVEIAFPKMPRMDNIAGQYLAARGLRQFRCAETEKFAHVTFFFNDYREEPFGGESRQMAQSPQVATYDLQPQMSAHAICALVLARINAEGPDGCEDFILVNFANGDMVGHTGKLDAAIAAVQVVDQCVGRIVEATLARGGKLIVTADHGNAEQMFDPDRQSAHTAHTLYPVQCIVVDPGLGKDSPLGNDGRLADVFPTLLQLMGLPQPAVMTGQSLLADKSLMSNLSNQIQKVEIRN